MSIFSGLTRLFTGNNRPVEIVAPPSPGVQQPPASWNTQLYLPAGQPIRPVVTYGQSVEPRAFSFPPMINTTITPRVGYGLMGFDEINTYINSAPEPQILIGLIKKEASVLKFALKDAKGENVYNSKFNWMITKPDGQNECSVWLNLWLDSILKYDAGCLYKRKIGTQDWQVNKNGTAIPINDISQLNNGRDVLTKSGGITVGLEIIDGSTIFPVITNEGHRPQSPLPAYVQIINGAPYRWLNNDQIWYKPRFPKANAPYGTPAIEECRQSVEVLQWYWMFKQAWYQYGTQAVATLTAPAGWTEEQVLQFQKDRGTLLAGNPELRNQVQYLPDGFKPLSMPTFGDKSTTIADDYKTAWEKLCLSFGVPPSERGEAPGQGFGGKAWHEGGADVFSRQVIMSLMAYLALPFNEVLQDEYKITRDELFFEVEYPTGDIDQEAESAAALEDWKNNALQLDEYREKRGYTALGSEDEPDPRGSMFFSELQPKQAPAQFAQQPQQEEAVQLSLPTVKVVNKEKPPVKVKVIKKRAPRITKAQRQFFFKHCGVCEEDDDFYGAPVSRAVPVAFPEKMSNNLEIVSISNPEGEARAAIWRPESGVKEGQREWVGGDVYPREEAVYLLDRALELHLVPVAYCTEVDNELGAIVHYVAGSDKSQIVTDYDIEWQDLAGLLDYITGQTDRNTGNWLTHPEDEGRPILIDNGLSFIPNSLNRPLKSPFVTEWLNKPLSDESYDLLYLAINNAALWDDLADLVGDEAAQEAKERAILLYDGGKV